MWRIKPQDAQICRPETAENRLFTESRAMQTYLKTNVIVVEDDEDLRLGICEYLQIRGFNVFQAACGSDFHAALEQSRIDVAVLDVNLPDVNGFSLARTLGSRKDVGIIMLTARRAREDKLRGYEEGADLYFTKPVDTEELALAITNLAKRISQKASNNEVNAQVQQQNWVLDRKRMTLISPGGSQLQLSGRETLLIEFLALSPETTIPRMEVLNFYDPANKDPFSRRFDMALGRLRQKASESGIDLPIQAIRGSGVRVIEKIEVI